MGSIGFALHVGVNVTMRAGAMTTAALVMQGPLEERRSIPEDRRSIAAALNFARDLQAWIPSYQLCSTLALPALPQFPNQEPPRPQQLVFQDFAMMPHLGHKTLMAVATVASVKILALVKMERRIHEHGHCSACERISLSLSLSLCVCLPACLSLYMP